MRERLPAEERREHLLDVAAELVADQGIEAVTMERLAEWGGVSKGLGYVYFDNAEDVLIELFDREIGELDRQVRRGVAEAERLEDKIRVTLDVWFDAFRDRGALVGALLELGSREAFAEREARRDRRVEAYWVDQVLEEFDMPRKRAAVAANVLLTGAEAVFRMWGQRRAGRRELVDDFVRMAMGGIRELAACS